MRISKFILTHRLWLCLNDVEKLNPSILYMPISDAVATHLLENHTKIHPLICVMFTNETFFIKIFIPYENVITYEVASSGDIINISSYNANSCPPKWWKDLVHVMIWSNNYFKFNLSSPSVKG